MSLHGRRGLVPIGVKDGRSHVKDVSAQHRGSRWLRFDTVETSSDGIVDADRNRDANGVSRRDRENLMQVEIHIF
jgi:hypothetical protein